MPMGRLLTATPNEEEEEEEEEEEDEDARCFCQPLEEGQPIQVSMGLYIPISATVQHTHTCIY